MDEGTVGRERGAVFGTVGRESVAEGVSVSGIEDGTVGRERIGSSVLGSAVFWAWACDALFSASATSLSTSFFIPSPSESSESSLSLCDGCDGVRS